MAQGNGKQVRMHHLRFQESVGQGFFHTAVLKVGDSRFLYVYDCGSIQTGRVRDSIAARFDGMESIKVDALFLSHLHEDHVSGLDHLLARVDVDAVFLPLLSPEARLSCVVGSIERGSDTVNQVDLIADPGAWFRARGVRRVIFIDGEGNAGDGVIPGQPSPPPDGPDGGNLGIDFEGLERFMHKELLVPFRQSAAGKRARAMLHRKDQVISHVAPIHISEAGRGLLDWVFITYVFPNDEAESRLRGILRRRLNLPPQGPAAFRRWIIDKLRRPSKRALLHDCIEDAGVRQNYMSMSLYSGPTTQFHPELSVYRAASGMEICDDDRCGWLGTGDSELATDIAWNRFHAHYRQIIPRVQTLAVPHHGSQRNFNAEFLQLGAKDFVVTSRTGSRVHPAPTVRRQLQLAARFHHVNQRPNSLLVQEFYRTA